MKESLLTQLRDRHTSMVDFKRASDKLAGIIAAEIASSILEEPISIHTPLKETMGKKTTQDVVLIPILRAGFALLRSFLRFFENARVGFVGVQRDAEANPVLYYEKIPLLKASDRIIILDPIVATGGSTVITLEKLIAAGGSPDKITVVGMVGAPEGIKTIQKAFSEVEIKITAVDEGLDEHKYIVPGLGDFGDRYFGC